MERDLQQILERIATGIEKLGEDPVINIETGPPVCPHCERMNPEVSVEEREARGPLGTFVIKSRCEHCHNIFYALPVHYYCFKTVEELRMGLEERAAESGLS